MAEKSYSTFRRRSVSSPKKAITDIAYESGFGSTRTMNRSFANEYGISPSEVRKNVILPKLTGTDMFNTELSIGD